MNFPYLMAVLACVWFFIMGFVIGMPYKDQSRLVEKAVEAIEDCQKDLPRSQVCELTAKVKERKE